MEQLDAVAYALKQNHPDLSADLDRLIQKAINVGHLQGVREDLDITKSQFRAYLSPAIKKALVQPSQ
jgi:glutamyl-tRNA reductase